MKNEQNTYRPSVKMLKIVVSILALYLMTGNLLYAQKRITREDRPKWVDKVNPGIYVGISHRFPDETDARADALADARRQIIETLGGIIESEFVDEIVESSGEITTNNAFTSSRIKVVSRNIISVKPDKVFVEKWKIREGFKSRIEYQAFVAVPFSEEKHHRFMKELVDETVNLGEKRFKESLELAQRGQILLALDQMQTVRSNVLPMTKITGLSPKDLSLLNSFKEKVQAMMEQIPGSVRIEGQGGNQSAKMGLPVAEPLEISVFWLDGDQKYPLPDLSVSFSVINGKATLDTRDKTDKHGKASCTVKNIASAGKIEVQANIHFPESLRIANNQYKFTLLPDNKIMVKILETNLDKPVDISYLENALLEQLTTAGFQVIENNPFSQLTETEINAEAPEKIAELVINSGVDLVILGSIASDQTNRIQDGFFFAQARGTLKVYNIQRKLVVGNYMIEDKNAGNSEENAGSKAIKKVSDQLIEQMLTEIGLK